MRLFVRFDTAGVADLTLRRVEQYPGEVFSGQASTPELERALCDLDARLTRDFVAGDAFSTADCVLLPFLFRIRKELEIPADASRLRAYLDRAFAQPSFRRTVAEPYWWWW
mmetsp:Transcript_8799/g.23855  ORF Transcript_8799/g.23855 Transcript_8799/m.23855 type:complete len:111 (+) Transcript_8799:143-475(+)